MAASTSDVEAFKVVLLGEGAVGKSSILLRYIESKFNDKHISTVQASFATKRISVDDKIVELNIWDTAGQEKYHSLGPIYYRGSHCAILVYDITDTRSFERTQNWVRELQEVLKGKAAVVIVGNKLDLESSRNVSETDASAYAASVGAEYAECSAKENVGIDELFTRIARLVIEREHNRAEIENSTGGTLRRSNSRRTIQVVDDTADSQQQRSRKCC